MVWKYRTGRWKEIQFINVACFDYNREEGPSYKVGIVNCSNHTSSHHQIVSDISAPTDLRHPTTRLLQGWDTRLCTPNFNYTQFVYKVSCILQLFVANLLLITDLSYKRYSKRTRYLVAFFRPGSLCVVPLKDNSLVDLKDARCQTRVY